MFGGLAMLLNGNMAGGVHGDALAVRPIPPSRTTCWPSAPPSRKMPVQRARMLLVDAVQARRQNPPDVTGPAWGSHPRRRCSPPRSRSRSPRPPPRRVWEERNVRRRSWLQRVGPGPAGSERFHVTAHDTGQHESPKAAHRGHSVPGHVKAALIGTAARRCRPPRGWTRTRGSVWLAPKGSL